MFQKHATIKENRINEQGFTLIEILVSMVIFSIGILAIASIQVWAMKLTSTAGDTTVQAVEAQNKLEELFALPYDDPWLEAAGNPPGEDSDENTHQETASEGMTVSWDVIDDDPVPNSKYITVTVTGGGKTTQMVSIKSY
jgi:type IV pilus assembly protein PilV